jgi:hypothetical protein
MIAKADRLEWWPRANIRVNPNNVRTHSDEQIDQLAQAMRKVWTYPCLVAEDEGNPQHGEIIAGHARFEASLSAGYTDQVKVLVAEGWSRQQIDEYVLFDNQIGLQSDWDEAALTAELDRMRQAYGAASIAGLGWSQAELEERFNPKPERTGVIGSLSEAFGVPPFSILNARDGSWQARKRGWMALGIRSEVGRGDLVEGKASHRDAPGGGGRLYAGKTAQGKTKAATQYSKPKRKPDGR